MKQFTVYGKNKGGNGAEALYIVNFIDAGAIAYPLRAGWDEECERIEAGINKRLSWGASNPLSRLMEKV